MVWRVIWTFNYKAHIPKPVSDTGRTTFTPLRSQPIGTHLRFVVSARGVVQSGNISVPGTFGFEFYPVFPSVTIDHQSFFPLFKSFLQREDFKIPKDIVSFFPVRGVSWYSWGWFLKGIHNLSENIKGILVGTHNVYDDENDPLQHSNLFLNPQGHAFYEDVRSYFYTGNLSDPRVVNPTLVPRRLFDNLRLYVRFFDTVYIFRPTEYARRRYYRLVEEEFIPIMNVLQGLSWLEPHPIKDDGELQELIGVPTEGCAVFWSFALGEALYTAVFPGAEGYEILPYPKFRPPTLNTEFLRNWLNRAYDIQYKPSRYANPLPVTDWYVIDGPGWASWSWDTPIYNEDDVRKFVKDVYETGGNWQITYASFSTSYQTYWGIETPAVLNVPPPLLLWTSTTGNYIVLGFETEDVPGENITLVEVRDSDAQVGKSSYLLGFLVARAHIGITPTKRLKETTVLYRPPKPEVMNRAFSPWLELEEVFVVPYGGKIKPKYQMKPREHYKVVDYMTTPDTVTTTDGVEVTPDYVPLVWTEAPMTASNVHFAPERGGLQIDNLTDSISFKLPIVEMGRAYRDFVDANLLSIVGKSIEKIRERLTERRYLHRKLAYGELTGWQYGVVSGRPSPDFVVDMTTEKVRVTLRDFWMKVGNPPFKLITYRELPEYEFGGYPWVEEREVPGTQTLNVHISEVPPPFLYTFPSLPIDMKKLTKRGLKDAPRVVVINSSKITPPEIQTVHTLWIDDNFPSSFVVWKFDEKGKVKWMVLVDPSAWDDLPVDDLTQILSATKIWNAYRCDESEWTTTPDWKEFGPPSQLQRYNQPVLVSVYAKSSVVESFSEGMNDLDGNSFVVTRSFSDGRSARLEFTHHLTPHIRLTAGLKDETRLPFIVDFRETLKCIGYRLGLTDDDVFDNRDDEVRKVVLLNPKGNAYPSSKFRDGYIFDENKDVRLVERGERVSPRVVGVRRHQISPTELLPFVRLISLIYRFRGNLKVSVSASGEVFVTTREDFFTNWLKGKSLGVIYPPNVLGVPLSVPVVDWSMLSAPTVTLNERLPYERTTERGVFDGGVSLKGKEVADDFDYRIFSYPLTDHLQVNLFFPKGLREMKRFVASDDGKLPTIPFSHFSLISPPYEVLGCFYYPSSVYNFVAVSERPPLIPITFSLTQSTTIYTHPDEVVLPYKLPKMDYVVVLRRSEGDDVILYDPTEGDKKPLRLDWKGYWWEEGLTEKWEPSTKRSVTPGLKLAMETVDLCVGMSDEGKVFHRLNPKRPYHPRIHLLGVIPDVGFPTVAFLSFDGKVYGVSSCQFPTVRFLTFTPTTQPLNTQLKDLRREIQKLMSELDGNDPFHKKLQDELGRVLGYLPETITEHRDEFRYYLFYKPLGDYWNWENGKFFYGEEGREPVVLGVVGVSPPHVFVDVNVSVARSTISVGGIIPNIFIPPPYQPNMKYIPLELLPLLLGGENSLNFSIWGKGMYPSVVEVVQSLWESNKADTVYFGERMKSLQIGSVDAPLWLGSSYVGNAYELHPLKRAVNNIVYIQLPYIEWKSNYKEPTRSGRNVELKVKVGDTDLFITSFIPVSMFVNFPFDRFVSTMGNYVVSGGLFTPPAPTYIFSKVISPTILFGFPYKKTEETNFSWDEENNMVFRGIELGCRSLLWTLRSTGNLVILKDSDLNCLDGGIPPIVFVHHPIVGDLGDIFAFPFVDIGRCFLLCRYLFTL